MATCTEDVLDQVCSRFDEVEAAARRQWTQPLGTRTRHFVVDGLLPNDVCRAAYGAFPPNAAGFLRRDSFRERKFTSVDLGAREALLKRLLDAMQHPALMSRIASITGIAGLEPDPTLYAGGLSMMYKGDFSNPHIDNSHDALRERYRRLNLLFYVSPDWTLANGANLELWDDGVRHQKTIVSAFNRLVVMETHRSSYHSVSPQHASLPRCCVSTYYFSKRSPDGAEYFHPTAFTGRPDEPLLRLIRGVDNSARGMLSRVLKARRRRSRVAG